MCSPSSHPLEGTCASHSLTPPRRKISVAPPFPHSPMGRCDGSCPRCQTCEKAGNRCNSSWTTEFQFQFQFVADEVSKYFQFWTSLRLGQSKKIAQHAGSEGPVAEGQLVLTWKLASRGKSQVRCTKRPPGKCTAKGTALRPSTCGRNKIHHPDK